MVLPILASQESPARAGSTRRVHLQWGAITREPRAGGEYPRAAWRLPFTPSPWSVILLACNRPPPTIQLPWWQGWCWPCRFPVGMENYLTLRNYPLLHNGL